MSEKTKRWTLFGLVILLGGLMATAAYAGIFTSCDAAQDNTTDNSCWQQNGKSKISVL